LIDVKWRGGAKEKIPASITGLVRALIGRHRGIAGGKVCRIHHADALLRLDAELPIDSGIAGDRAVSARRIARGRRERATGMASDPAPNAERLSAKQGVVAECADAIVRLMKDLRD
jgi:hypothetical protein